MKCPKCGYNSFEYHDACKKCANDLSGYKVTYGLKEIVLPQEARASMAAALMAETAASSQVPEAAAEAAPDMFSFDDEQKSAQAQAKAEEDAFADLLESSSQETPAPAPAASSPGEFDLNNFSWDDTPAAPAAAETKPEDDFNSLFGDLDDTPKK